LERQIFPKVLDKGLFGYRFEGFWIDCGTRESFLRAQRIMMDRGRRMMSNTDLGGASRIVDPNYLDEVRGVDCAVGPYVSAHKGVMLDEGCEVSDSILMDRAALGPYSVVRGSIVGPGFKVGPNKITVDSILALR
jgi:mannose-1-phosphate guanylyltransferase